MDFHAEIEKLNLLLEQQIESFGRGDMKSVEEIAEKTGQTVKNLIGNGDIRKWRNCRQWQNVMSLYDKVILMLSGEKQQVNRQLDHIKQGRRTVSLYSDNNSQVIYE